MKLYVLLFLGMLVEGPAITAAGAFAAAVGFFNLWLVFLLSVIANILPDFLFYAIGFWGQLRIISKYGHYFGVTRERMATAEQLIEKHSGKAIIAIKLIPFIAFPGLVVAGATRMNLRKYALWCASIAIPSSLIYLLLGYYFGDAYQTVIHYLNIGGYLIAAGVAALVLIIYLEKKYSKRIVKKITD